MAAGVRRFIYTSTTSVFGHALLPPPGTPAAWITEHVTPVPKNIYGITKFAAENLCELFYRSSGLPCVVLRTSRFFPENDDDRVARQRFDSDNLKVNEILDRRADLQDIVSAHQLAIAKAPGFGLERFPQYEQEYARRGWSMATSIDRVYANDHARTRLGWAPRYDFRTVLKLLADGQDYRSPLAREVGAKGYHAQTFVEGPYPV